MNGLILLRGGGDLASGVALRLHHAGFDVVIAELPRPLAVRRLVSFSEAVYAGQATVEDVTARLVTADQVQVTREADCPVRMRNQTGVSVLSFSSQPGEKL